MKKKEFKELLISIDQAREMKELDVDNIKTKIDSTGQYYWDFPINKTETRPLATKTIGGKKLKLKYKK